MKQLLLIATLLLMGTAGFAQQQNSYTLNFDGVTLLEAIEKIETASGKTFFFDPDWIASEKKQLTGSVTNATLDETLNAILGKTGLNFVVDGDRVILTKGTQISSALPQGYFTQKGGKTNAGAPVFFKQYEGVKTDGESVAIVGKAASETAKTYTLSGQVTDSKTGKPIPNLNVRSRNTKKVATTDLNGNYSLEVSSGSDVIETDSFEYRKWVRQTVIYGNGTLDINLNESGIQLDEVVINIQKKEKLRTAVTGITSINIEEIKTIPLILGERDIFRVAAALPGIKSVGEGAAGYSVRGGKEDQNLILLDNALLYNPAHFFGFFSAVNPFTTAKADIYKGSIPAEFGGRLSSVFDLTSKNGSTEKITGEGGIGPVSSNLMVTVPVVKGKSSVLAGGRATYSDWILKSLDEESLKNSQASFYDAILKYSHKLSDNDNIEATGYYSRDRFSVTSDSVITYSNRLLALKWNHTFNKKNKGALIVTNSEYRFNIDFQSGDQNAFDSGYKLDETQLQLKMNYTPNNDHKFSYGIASKLYRVQPGYLHPKSEQGVLDPLDLDREKALESAFYVSDSYEITEKLLVDVGLRFSYFAALGSATQRTYQSGAPITDGTVTGEKTCGNNEVIETYNGLEPRIAARYAVTDNFSIKASYDKANQYIHLLSNNTTQSPTDTWKLSDLNIKPQVAEQFSVGLYKNLDSGTYELSLEGYYKKSKNFLDYRTGASLSMNDNIETELLQGRGKAYGVEFLVRKSEGRLNGWVGYTYSRTFIKLDSQFAQNVVNNGDYFPANFDKPHDFSAVMNFKLTKRYSFSGNLVYQTGRPITYPIGQYVYNGATYTMYSDRNQFRVPDYYRLDLGINIEGNHKIKKLAHSFWNISVYNVLGRNNPYSVFFVTEEGKVKAYKTSIFTIPVPTITYNFKF